jgi:hypothetical protein
VAHNVALKTLAEHIAQQLKERGLCVVVDRDLERCWPSSRMARGERDREIQEFAESQGWTAAIRDAGFDTRAIFRKLEPGTDAASISSLTESRRNVALGTFAFTMPTGKRSGLQTRIAAMENASLCVPMKS